MREGDIHEALVQEVWDKLAFFSDVDVYLEAYGRSPLVHRNVFAAWCLYSQVMNGGFHQFFYNPHGIVAPEAVVGFLGIGMPETAGVVRKAIDMFPRPYPRDRILRWDHVPEEDDGRFRWLDDEFCKVADDEAGGFLALADRYAESAVREMELPVDD
jgi:hypothetical protein